MVGIANGEKLKQSGVEVIAKVSEKSPHAIIVLHNISFGSDLEGATDIFISE